MPFDAQLPQPALPESDAQPRWARLSRWLCPTRPTEGDPALGYESALPWTLGADAPDGGEQARY